MKVCRKCRSPQEDSLLIECPWCHAPFVEESDEPQPLSSEDLDRVAARVAKLFRQDEDLDRIAEKIRGTFKKDDWKLLVRELVKSLHIVHDADIIAKCMMGMWRFWVVFIVALGLLYLLLMDVVGESAKEVARKRFDSEVTKQIALQFQEPKISNIVVAVASLQSSNLMAHAVTPQIDKFNYTLNTW